MLSARGGNSYVFTYVIPNAGGGGGSRKMRTGLLRTNLYRHSTEDTSTLRRAEAGHLKGDDHVVIMTDEISDTSTTYYTPPGAPRERR